MRRGYVSDKETGEDIVNLIREIYGAEPLYEKLSPNEKARLRMAKIDRRNDEYRLKHKLYQREWRKRKQEEKKNGG